jgi:dephospho-CoA kinase
MKIGIAGGIGSGKSYVCKRLQQRGIEVYDCDAAAKRLMRTSSLLRRQLSDLIGPDTYLREESEYLLNKKVVAEFLLQSEENAQAVDAIVHPAVFRDFEDSGLRWMESALMYESGIYRLVDRVVVVTAPEEVRLQRIIHRDSITREKAFEWIHRQWPQEEVRQRADYEIVNDGAADIDHQLDQLFTMLAIPQETDNNHQK